MITIGYLLMAVVSAAILVLKLGPGRDTYVIVAIVLAACAIPWYFGTRDRSREPGRLEQGLATGWLVLRRILGFGSAAVLIPAASYMAWWAPPTLGDLRTRWLAAGFLFAGAVMMIWFAVFGQGNRRYQLRDDVALHRSNRRRYRWRF